ncbi:thioesterase family protein [Porphyrobacter sp. GA68]|uniref:thioesterase family protein n=1 Tax=Porphyrobacter sp. GA68 TaxID=2883480 RepID=UPI001D1869B7|nr:thioesterase family protein [Porphyrobacter sp. GA68]
MSFAAVIASAREREGGGMELTVPETWLQGRTAYGGLSAALALNAAKRSNPQLPPLRSAQIAFVGPLSGQVSVAPRLLRSGRNATWIAVEVTGEGGCGLVATFVFMHRLPSETQLKPTAAPAGIIPPVDARPVGGHERPAFLQHHFETRFALPKKEAKEPDICLWARLSEREGLDVETELMLVGDALPPAVVPVMPQRGPVSSMTWQINFFVAPVQADGDNWWLLRSRADEAGAGTSSQHMMLWDEGGNARAAGTQTVAVFA